MPLVNYRPSQQQHKLFSVESLFINVTNNITIIPPATKFQISECANLVTC